MPWPLPALAQLTDSNLCSKLRDFMPTSTVTAPPGTSPGVSVWSAASHSRAVLEVDASLAALLPRGGLRRGETVTVVGSTSLALTLLSRAPGERAWCAIGGVPTLGLAAAAEAGLDLERLALVARPMQR